MSHPTRPPTSVVPRPPGARRRLGLLDLGPGIALVSLVIAASLSPDEASALAIPVLGALGMLATPLMASLVDDEADRRFVRNLMFLGIGLRFLGFTALHLTVGPYVLAPDQFTYEAWGRGLLVSWQTGGPLPARLQGTFQLAHPAMNAVLFAIFGPALKAPAVVNIFLSAWVGVPLYRLCRLILRDAPGVGRTVVALSVLFPSLMIWSVLNIREAPTILVVATATYFLVRLQLRGDLWALVGAAASLLVLTFFREYMTLLVGSAGTAGILIGRSGSPIRSLGLGLVLLGGLTYAVQTSGAGLSLAEEPSLSQAQEMREAFQYDAGSAYGQAADVSTATGALTYLPIGLAYFMLAPFPWEIGSTLQAITLPETLIWWLLVPFGFLGFLVVLRRDLRSYTVILAILLTVTFAYALVESNVGTAYRHRAQVLPLGFILCAIGINHLRTRRRDRQRMRRERLMQARRSFR